ncbi:hypothetical protein BP6252_11400 [Coleophoma cylindrospora]|uniref:Uncharacterized protein n=1 Tax=Coleophoma cylindrospora TaxID=1849047 RepID=A0A3D8QJP4_9HELO|nr:hypothetical protein BP6252_11400 [Coleophoma cylindrospora]
MAAEPAVLHAVLALSSAHKRDIAGVGSLEVTEITIPNKHEQFTLRHYNQAISDLQPHFSAKDPASLRVALITCVLFVCLECLGGNYKAAKAHLQNGLKILRETTQSRLSTKGNSVWVLESSTDATYNHITDTFARLHMQAELWGQATQHLCLVPRAAGSLQIPITFESIYQARQYLHRLLSEIFYLTDLCCGEGKSNAGYAPRQRNIQEKLASWLRAYKASSISLQVHVTENSVAYKLLHAYYYMANIMANTFLQPQYETRFDSHISDFVSIITISIELWKVALLAGALEKGTSREAEMSSFVADMGWIAPLYFTAIKCRNHRVRLHAIRLLSSTSHKEGIWDTKVATYIAREVMRIEEKDFYKDLVVEDDFPLSEIPAEEHMSMPLLPESYRAQEVQVVLPDQPRGNIVLICRQKRDNSIVEYVYEREYIISHTWIDKI